MSTRAMVATYLGLWLVAYVLLGLVAGRQSAARLHRILPDRYAGTRSLTRFMSQTRAGRVLSVCLWPVLVSIIQIGFFLGWWDIFGRRS